VTAVAFLGLGRMGVPMAARLAAAGHELTVWNRTPRPERQPAGAAVAESPARAAAGAEVVITMVSAAAALENVLDGAHGALAGASTGAAFVDMSTVGPAAAQAAAARAAQAGCAFVDAPVSGSVASARAGTLIAMAGGDAAAVDRVRPVLAAIVSDVVHVGPTGAGAGMKLALNLALAVTNQAVAETLVLAEAAGVPRERAYDVLVGGALGSPFVRYKRAAFEDPGAAPVAFAVDLMRKDTALALELAARDGVALPVGGAAHSALERAAAAGFGGRDIAAMVELVAGATAPADRRAVRPRPRPRSSAPRGRG
jgi:3-hydroxyisobutyrate dehydrogenase-like beta-hydroxyacid dehydrogenase